MDAIERLVVRIFADLVLEQPELTQGLEIRNEAGEAAFVGRSGETNVHLRRLLGLVQLEQQRLQEPRPDRPSQVPIG